MEMTAVVDVDANPEILTPACHKLYHLYTCRRYNNLYRYGDCKESLKYRVFNHTSVYHKSTGIITETS